MHFSIKISGYNCNTSHAILLYIKPSFWIDSHTNGCLIYDNIWDFFYPLRQDWRPKDSIATVRFVHDSITWTFIQVRSLRKGASKIKSILSMSDNTTKISSKMHMFSVVCILRIRKSVAYICGTQVMWTSFLCWSHYFWDEGSCE